MHPAICQRYRVGRLEVFGTWRRTHWRVGLI